MQVYGYSCTITLKGDTDREVKKNLSFAGLKIVVFFLWASMAYYLVKAGVLKDG